MQAPYRDLNRFLQDKFGEKVQKVSINAGFSCPNLDGKISDSGCIFCNNESILPRDLNCEKNILKQLEEGITYIKKRHKARQFIAYLQPYSNTYASLDKLREIYEPLINQKDVYALAISTRPDCVDKETLDYIAELSKKKYLWLELGLQSASDETLKRINRGHTFADFLKAFKGATERNIPVCVHLILGFPWETRETMLDTVKTISDLNPFGIKIHALHVVKNTKLYDDYEKGVVKLLSFDSYVNLVADALEIMNPEIVIHRLTGEGPRDITVAPDWIFNKMAVINAIKNELEKRGSCQGSKYRDQGSKISDQVQGHPIIKS
jgi:uncharacterized protein